MLSVSTRVERNIDGMWFPAIILQIDRAAEVVTLQYIDDDNVEDMVPSNEVRIPFRDSADSKQVERKTTLSKPLAGLMDDDWEERQRHMPRAIVHMSEDDEVAGIYWFLLFY